MKNTNRKLTIELDSIGEAALAADADTNVIWMNAGAEQLTGWSASDAIGRSLNEVMIVLDTRGSVPIGIPSVDDLRAGLRATLPQRVSLESKCGNLRQINWMVTLAHDEDDPRAGIGIVFCDVTDELLRQKTINEERIHLNTTIKAANIGTWSWNLSNGRITANERWAEMAGYRLDELAPLSLETWRSILHPDDEQPTMDEIAKHFAGETEYYVCEFRLRHKLGHWVWVRRISR